VEEAEAELEVRHVPLIPLATTDTVYDPEVDGVHDADAEVEPSCVPLAVHV
jgi:hypothetical protein